MNESEDSSRSGNFGDQVNVVLTTIIFCLILHTNDLAAFSRLYRACARQLGCRDDLVHDRSRLSLNPHCRHLRVEGKAQKTIFQEQHLVVLAGRPHKLWRDRRENRAGEYVETDDSDP